MSDDEFKTDPKGLAPPSAVPMMTCDLFFRRIGQVMDDKLEPVKESQTHQSAALQTLTDRMTHLEADQGDLRGTVRTPSWMAWAALLLGLTNTGGILVLLAVAGFR